MLLKTLSPLNSSLRLFNKNVKNVNSFRSFSYINQNSNINKFNLSSLQQISKRNNSNDAEKVVEETSNKAVEFTNTLPDFTNTETVSTLTDKTFGYLKSLGMAEHPFTWLPDTIQQVLELEHVYLGMQWGTAIIVTTLIGRALIMPLNMKQREVSFKQAKFQKESATLSEKLYDGDYMHYQKISAKINKLRLKHEIDGQMKYMFLPVVVNSAFAISMFSAIKEMCNYPVMGMDVGGWSWFSDLSAVDPYLGLQLVSSISIFLYTKFGMMQDMDAVNSAQTSMFSSKGMKRFLLALPFLSIPFTMALPSGVVLFISVSALTSALSSRLIKNTAVRKLYGFKPYPTPQQLAALRTPAAGNKKATGFFSMMDTYSEQIKKQQDFMKKYR